MMDNVLAIIIERESDTDTDLVTKLRSSIVQHEGMVQGDIDISSTRYTGTDIAVALDMDTVKDPDEALDVVKKEFKEQFDQTWAETYGFENSYSLAVTEKFAEENNIETISDLEPYADELKFGVDNAWVN